MARPAPEDDDFVSTPEGDEETQADIEQEIDEEERPIRQVFVSPAPKHSEDKRDQAGRNGIQQARQLPAPPPGQDQAGDDGRSYPMKPYVA